MISRAQGVALGAEEGEYECLGEVSLKFVEMHACSFIISISFLSDSIDRSGVLYKIRFHNSLKNISPQMEQESSNFCINNAVFCTFMEVNTGLSIPAAF